MKPKFIIICKIGQPKGIKLNTKKSVIMKEKILNDSSSFNGELSGTELMNKLKISRNAFYKYKRELKAEIKDTR